MIDDFLVTELDDSRYGVKAKNLEMAKLLWFSLCACRER